MIDRDYIVYLEDMLDAVLKVEQFVQGIDFHDFAQDDKTKFAVIRALEIVGESCKNIPQTIRDAHPELPWKEMAGMRDKLIHQYFGIDLEVVWNTVSIDLPIVKTHLLGILSKAP